jgi:hypothetical protein
MNNTENLQNELLNKLWDKARFFIQEKNYKPTYIIIHPNTFYTFDLLTYLESSIRKKIEDEHIKMLLFNVEFTVIRSYDIKENEFIIL